MINVGIRKASYSSLKDAKVSRWSSSGRLWYLLSSTRITWSETHVHDLCRLECTSSMGGGDNQMAVQMRGPQTRGGDALISMRARPDVKHLLELQSFTKEFQINDFSSSFSDIILIKTRQRKNAPCTTWTWPIHTHSEPSCIHNSLSNSSTKKNAQPTSNGVLIYVTSALINLKSIPPPLIT